MVDYKYDFLCITPKLYYDLYERAVATKISECQPYLSLT